MHAKPHAGHEMPPAGSPSRARRFRPSAAALSGTRAYVPRAASPGAVAAAAAKTARSSKRRWSCNDSRGGRLIRRHGGGRLATQQSERTLIHIVTTFAVELAKAAAAERASAGSATEEGDVRRALSHAMRNAAAEKVSGAAKAVGRQPPPQPLHPSLLE